jgi:hypothetical protein
LIALKENQVTQGGRKREVEAAVTFGDPPKTVFAAREETQTKR